MGWVPLFDGILDSTVWELPPAYVKVWVTLLALKDVETGDVWCTEAALARRAKLKPSIVRKALEIFMAPDPQSRSQAEEGRRLLPLSRGWKIVNHDLYQDRMMGKKEGKKSPSSTRVRPEFDPSSTQKRNQLGINSESSGGPTIENPSVHDTRVEKKEESKTDGEKSEAEKVEVGGTPSWDLNECWQATASIWKEAPQWKDKSGRVDSVDSGYKPFVKKINEKNWPSFWKHLNWEVTKRFDENKAGCPLFTFINGDWQAVTPPVKVLTVGKFAKPLLHPDA